MVGDISVWLVSLKKGVGQNMNTVCYNNIAQVKAMHDEIHPTPAA